MNSPRNRVESTALAVWAGLVLSTPLAIRLVYGGAIFTRWPWLRVSFVLATLTVLWCFTLWFLRPNRLEKTGMLVTFLIGISPLDFLLVYPGAGALGIWSDDRASLLIVALALLHGLGFFILQNRIIEYLAVTDEKVGGAGGLRADIAD